MQKMKNEKLRMKEKMLKKLQILTYLLLIYSFMHRKFPLDLFYFIIQMQKAKARHSKESPSTKNKIKII